MKILFYGTKNYDEEFFEKLLPSYPGITIKFTEANIHEETASLAKGYEAICAFVNADLSTPVIEELNAQGVKLILMRCAGYNNVDLETAHKFGMKVLRVPGYSPEAVAEHAMALALTANRHTHKAYIKCRENNFSLSGLMGLNFYQKTAGIIGTGKIGQAMAKICKGFGMRVIAYDLFPNKSLDYLEYVSLDELLATSDLISLHCPLTEETKHIINEETIAKMKDGVILVNTSRGGLIKTEDLISGIRDHKFFAVGLDVYEEETDFVFEDMSERILQSSITQRLLSFPNVVMTSHQGFFTKEALTNIAETTLENAKASYTLSENARINPDPAEITAWDEEWQFIATADNKESRVYHYTYEYSDISKSGNVVLETQADVDKFKATQINSIDGNLTIGTDNGDGIENLDGLSNLECFLTDAR